MEAAHRQAILDGRFGFRPLKPRVFTEVIGEFMGWLETEYAKASTRHRIITSMTSASVFFGKQMVSTIAPADVERYKAWRLKGAADVSPVKKVTVKHDLDNLSVFFGWAIKFDYARTNPVKDVTRPSDADAVRQHVITAEEERRYFSVATGNVRDVARLILLQGMRPEEVCGLAKTDVDLERGTVTVRFGKTNAATRTLRLTGESKGILGSRMGSLGPWIFPSPRKPGQHIVKLNNAHDRVCEKTGLAVVLYDFRHTFATRLAEAGVDAFAIAAILGHSSTRILNRYIHPTQQHQDEAMKLYEKRFGGKDATNQKVM